MSLAFPADDRIFSRAAFEIIVDTLSTEVDTDTLTGRIDQVHVTSNKIKGPDGNDLPASQQIDKLIVRP